jgi:hypothetical protein
MLIETCTIEHNMTSCRLDLDQVGEAILDWCYYVSRRSPRGV